MGTKERPADRGRAHGREALARVGREIRLAREDRGLSLRDVGSAAGLSAAQASRIERGRIEHASIVDLAAIHAVVGLELSVRSYPGGQPIRDVAHAQLLAGLRARLHRSLRWAVEVPLPLPGDRRAWDAMISGTNWRVGVEAETAPHDGQALARRLQLKIRDGGVDAIVLLLSDTRQSRQFVRATADALAELFPLEGRRALELLGAGVPPPASSIIVLPHRVRR